MNNFCNQLITGVKNNYMIAHHLATYRCNYEAAITRECAQLANLAIGLDFLKCGSLLNTGNCRQRRGY